MNTLHDNRYIKLILKLQEVRKLKGITQKLLASKLGLPQSYVAKVEGFERRLDLIELLDWLSALGSDLQTFLASTELMSNSTSIPALPIPGKVIHSPNGITVNMSWQSHEIPVKLEGISVE
jgi:transcriptional regulator with XRE-family HTH domain